MIARSAGWPSATSGPSSPGVGAWSADWSADCGPAAVDIDVTVAVARIAQSADTPAAVACARNSRVRAFFNEFPLALVSGWLLYGPVSYTHLRAHETPEH